MIDADDAEIILQKIVQRNRNLSNVQVFNQVYAVSDAFLNAIYLRISETIVPDNVNQVIIPSNGVWNLELLLKFLHHCRLLILVLTSNTSSILKWVMSLVMAINENYLEKKKEKNEPMLEKAAVVLRYVVKSFDSEKKPIFDFVIFFFFL